MRSGCQFPSSETRNGNLEVLVITVLNIAPFVVLSRDQLRMSHKSQVRRIDVIVRGDSWGLLSRLLRVRSFCCGDTEELLSGSVPHWRSFWRKRPCHLQPLVQRWTFSLAGATYSYQLTILELFLRRCTIVWDICHPRLSVYRLEIASAHLWIEVHMRDLSTYLIRLPVYYFCQWVRAAENWFVAHLSWPLDFYVLNLVTSIYCLQYGSIPGHLFLILFEDKAMIHWNWKQV